MGSRIANDCWPKGHAVTGYDLSAKQPELVAMGGEVGVLASRRV